MTPTLRMILKGALLAETKSTLVTVQDGDSLEAVIEVRVISTTVDGQEKSYQRPTHVYDTNSWPKDYGGTGQHH